MGYKDPKKFPKHYKSTKFSQSIDFRKERQYGTGGQYKFLKEIHKTAPVPTLNHDFKIQKDSQGYFYMVIPMDVSRNENQVPPKIISLDPGVRKFLTGYTLDGSVYYFGDGDIEYLILLNHRKQRLQSKIATMKSRGRSYHRHCHALERQSYKIRNLVNDAHRKIAKWLFENFEYIIIPKLDVGSFLRNPKLSKRAKNNLKTWRHGAFIEYLKYKNFEYLNSKLIIPTEEYTTKTCSQCGCVDYGFTSSEDYLCPNPECACEFDRDVNSALNILLKTLSF
jgi:putative transposase